MSYGTGAGRTARQRLGTPTLAMLPRVVDSLSFLYLESVRIVQDDTGICAQVESARGTDRVYIPAAALACVLLGPGTSITQPAMTSFARNGTTVVCTGSGGIRSYAYAVPTSLTTAWLERQAQVFADPEARTAAAVRAYLRRFGNGTDDGDDTDEIPDDVTVAQLRGMEGQRVKALYRLLAQKYRIARFKRVYDPAAWDEQDPVNRALSAANTCLYGVVHAAITALGASPALGVIHTGSQQAFVYDIADLYKSQLTIPLAFSLHASAEPDREARRHMREQFRLLRLLPAIVTDIQHILDPDAPASTERPRQVDLVQLWDPTAGTLPAGVNYAAEPDPPAEP